MTGLLVRDAELVGGQRADVRVAGGWITEIGERLARRPGERDVAARGGALLPGLHDHHLHLLAAAASADSVWCGPPQVTTMRQLRATLQAAAAGVAPGAWVRGVGYHQDVAGDLDRTVLDRWVADRPVRLQHRSGALWMVNSAAVSLLGADAGAPEGVERDDEGRATGRLWRVDGWLRERLGPPSSPPDLRTLGRTLASYGITGVTDATPDLDRSSRDLLLSAVSDGRLPQRLCLLGADDVPGAQVTPAARDRVSIGPRKLLLDDGALPDLPALAACIAGARTTRPDRRRPIAVHCVTGAALVLLLAALAHTGTLPGDRIEHGAVVPGATIPRLRQLGVTVVTQPSLVAERGDSYLRHVHPDDVPGLYRHASLLAAGIPVGLSSDAPYATVDPWAGIQAATTRASAAGAVVGAGERVDAATALAALTTPPGEPGGTARCVAVDQPADLCLLRTPLAVALRRPAEACVALTAVAGRVVYDAT